MSGLDEEAPVGTARRARLAGTLGLAAVVVGVLVLRSPGAAVEVGWFSYDGLPPELLDSLLAWNLTRAVGALLALTGVVVLAHLLGGLAGRRSGALAARLGGPALVLAGLLLLGTAAALVAATGLVVGAVGTGLRRRNAP